MCLEPTFLLVKKTHTPVHCSGGGSSLAVSCSVQVHSLTVNNNQQSQRKKRKKSIPGAQDADASSAPFSDDNLRCYSMIWDLHVQLVSMKQGKKKKNLLMARSCHCIFPCCIFHLYTVTSINKTREKEKKTYLWPK